MIRRMKDHEFPKVFGIMEASFPPDERRPYDEQKALLSDPRFTVYVNDDATAFITIWSFDDFAFAEHIAVDPTLRSSGMGSAMLKELIAALTLPLCLEAEPPVEDIQKRRIAFYERNGLTLNSYPYLQPPISKGKGIVPLMIMTSCGEISLSDFRHIREVLYREVYHTPHDFISKHFPEG